MNKSIFPAGIRYSVMAIAAAALLVSAASGLVAAPPPEPADLVVTNASVFTSDIRRPRANAFAVKDGRFVYVGMNRGARRYVGPATEVLDARGLSVTPGFVDNHCHVIWMAAMRGVMADTYAVNSVEQLRQQVQAYAAQHPDYPFVAAIGWKYDYIPGLLPDMALADTILADRPLFLWSYDGHTGWFNTRALEYLQRNPDAMHELTPQLDPVTSQPTGILLHFYAFNFLDYFTPTEITPGFLDDFEAGITAGIREALSFGVTTVNDVQIYDSFMPYLLAYKQKGGLDNIRARCSYFIAPEDIAQPAVLEQHLRDWIAFGQQHNDDHLVAGDSVKMYIDGVFGNHTAFMKNPYADAPDNRGFALWPQEDFNTLIEMVDRMGLQACTHGTGDAGIERIVNAYEHSRNVTGRTGARHRIEHCELPLPADQDRMARLGILAAMHPTHFFGSPVVDDALGQERRTTMMGWRTMQRRGIDVSFGSDWCAGPINPVYGILVATTRLMHNGEFETASRNTVTLNDAIRFWTIASARALWMEDRVGSIQVGKLADFVVWDTDLRTAAWQDVALEYLDELEELLTPFPLRLRGAGAAARGARDVASGLDDWVAMTFVGGRLVYAKPD